MMYVLFISSCPDCCIPLLICLFVQAFEWICFQTLSQKKLNPTNKRGVSVTTRDMIPDVFRGNSTEHRKETWRPKKQIAKFNDV